jgi:uncharacterized protein YjiS (DUF1127 family)
MAALQKSGLSTIRGAPIYSASQSAGTGRPGCKEVFEMFAPVLSRSVPLGSVTTFRVVSLAQRALDAFLVWQNARATERTLRRLSDQQLADIGLHRGAIADIAAEMARS